jgi:hypothetical protein
LVVNALEAIAVEEILTGLLAPGCTLGETEVVLHFSFESPSGIA